MKVNFESSYADNLSEIKDWLIKEVVGDFFRSIEREVSFCGSDDIATIVKLSKPEVKKVFGSNFIYDSSLSRNTIDRVSQLLSS